MSRHDPSVGEWANPPVIDRHLSARRVAELLDLHVNTVKRLGNLGELPFVRIGSRGDRRYPVAGIDAYLKRGTS